jgi:hypothetical protein
MSKLEREVADLTKREVELSERRSTAEQKLSAATTARQKLFLSGDLDDQRALNKAQQEVDIAASALSAIVDALGVLATQQREAQSALEAERAVADRKLAADTLAGTIDDFERRLPSFLSTAMEFIDITDALSPASWEAGQMAAHVRRLIGEVEMASAFVVADMRNMVPAILAGHRPIPSRQIAPEVIEPGPPVNLMSGEEELVEAFCLKPVKWRALDGSQKFARRWEDALLPRRLYVRATARGAVVPITDERRRKLRGAQDGELMKLDSPDTIDLDVDSLPPPEAKSSAERMLRDPATAAAEFTELDRGPPRTLRITP